MARYSRRPNDDQTLMRVKQHASHYYETPLLGRKIRVLEFRYSTAHNESRVERDWRGYADFVFGLKMLFAEYGHFEDRCRKKKKKIQHKRQESIRDGTRFLANTLLLFQRSV